MFSGSIPALVTPFTAGKLDEEAFRDLVEWQIAEGTHGLVACGTTGEAATLSLEEHRQVVALAIEVAAGRVDSRTVLCVLTHDPKFDVPLLEVALRLPDVAYVGAMGSRRTHEDRLARLREAGIDDVPVVVGGIIPPEDAEQLEQAGVAAVYTPKDFELNRIMADLVRIVESRAEGADSVRRLR